VAEENARSFDHSKNGDRLIRSDCEGRFSVMALASFFRKSFSTASMSDITGAGSFIARVRVDGWVGLLSLIVRPHTQDANRFLFGKNFIHDAVLNIDASRVCASKITDQLFEGRWILKWVDGKNREQFLRLWLKTTCSKLLCILHCLLGINNLPNLPLKFLRAFCEGLGHARFDGFAHARHGQIGTRFLELRSNLLRRAARHCCVFQK
jgi:hypothetical protein